MRGMISDGLLYVSSFFYWLSRITHWIAVWLKDAAIRVLLARRRKPVDRSDGGLDIETKHSEING